MNSNTEKDQNLPSSHKKKTNSFQFFFDILRQALSTLFMALFSIIIAAVYTRIFPPSEYGVYSTAVAFVAPIITLSSEWIAQPTSRFYSEYARRNHLSSLWQSINIFSLTILSVLLTLFTFIWVFLPTSFKSQYGTIYIEVFVVVILQSVTSIILPIFPAAFNTHLYRRITISTALSSAAISLIFIYTFGRRIEYLLLGQIIAIGLFLPLVLRWSKWQRLTVKKVSRSRIAHTMKRMSIYGLPMMVWFLSSSLLDLGDRYVIQFTRGSAEVGIYSVNYALMAGIVILINVPVSIMLGPLLFEQWGRRDIAGTTRSLTQATTLYFVIACALIGAGSLVCESLVQLLLGKEFHVGQIFLVPILVARAVWGISLIGQKSLELREKTRMLMIIAILSALLNLILNLFFVPKYGYIAAAYTTLFGYLFYLVLIYTQTRREVRWEIETAPAAFALISSLLSYAITYFTIRNWTQIPSIFFGTSMFLILFSAFFLTLSQPTRALIKRYLP